MRMDTRGNITFINEFAQDFFGYAAQEILGKNAVGTIIPETDSHGRSLKLMICNIAKHPERYIRNEHENMKSNGARIWISWTNKVVKSKEGRLAEILCIGNDITARKRMEDELLKTTNNLWALINASPLPIIALDAQSNVTIWNKAAQRVFGWEEQEVLNRRLSTIPSDGEMEFLQLTQQQLKGEPLSGVELKRQRKDGSLLDISLSSAPLYNSQGNVVGIMEVLEDITERKRAEEESLRFAKLESLSTLAGGIAHDFNNFLTAILGNIGLAMLDGEIEPRIRERLSQAEQACMRAQVLSRQLLTFAKGGAPVKKIFSITKILKETAVLTLAGSKSRYELSIPGNLWKVEADEGQINQVISNLLINADQAMP
jgi:two-component system, cell cycle sensor histidine kinase and response regulator CckA